MTPSLLIVLNPQLWELAISVKVQFGQGEWGSIFRLYLNYSAFYSKYLHQSSGMLLSCDSSLTQAKEVVGRRVRIEVNQQRSRKRGEVKILKGDTFITKPDKLLHHSTSARQEPLSTVSQLHCGSTMALQTISHLQILWHSYISLF